MNGQCEAIRDLRIRRAEAQVMLDIFENWPTTTSIRRALQQHICALQISLDEAIKREELDAAKERGKRMSEHTFHDDPDAYNLALQNKAESEVERLTCLHCGGIISSDPIWCDSCADEILKNGK